MVKPTITRWLLLCCIACLLPLSAQADLPDNIARIKPSIVVIATFKRLGTIPLALRGTGFAIGNGQFVATNAHVVRDVSEADEELLVLMPGLPAPRRLEFKIVAVSKEYDLAILRINTPLPPLKLATGTAREGQEIFFTGFPIVGALGPFPATNRGIISALTPNAMPGGNSGQLNAAAIRQLRNGPYSVYQLDATAYPGNSGSPVFDAESAEVIGIINSVLVKGSKETALTQPSGISYAIPVKYLGELLSSVTKEH
ncbi:MAG TPA: serine protease [Rhodocyclaceae bacterium]|jgi:S1-C subfamily serine protease|nr:serine protease [Rhodocyclaceae bacterium]